MNCNLETAQAILKMADDCLKSSDDPQFKLRKLWWSMLYMRARALSNDLRSAVGNKVMGGPFKGLILTNEAVVSYLSPIILGCYEHELHPVFEKIIAKNYTRILNIGCSVGYYAVGLALRMPQVIVEAFDIDPEARRKCGELAKLNGVQDRVRISGEFRGEDFARYAEEKPLVLMDIESAETVLLDPVTYPALQKMDVVVELHDLMNPAISKMICERFAGSHQIELIKNRNHMPDISDILPSAQNLSSVDQLLLGWEGRDGPTPWGIFWAK